MQAGKRLVGMPNGFSILPRGNAWGQREGAGLLEEAAPARGLPGTGTGGQREGAQPRHKQTCLLLLQGLAAWCGAAARMLALARNWSPLRNIFEALQGNVPMAFLLAQNLARVPCLPQPGAQGKLLGHSFQLRLTLQKYQQELPLLKNVAAVSLLAVWCARAKMRWWPQLHPGAVGQMVGTLSPGILVALCLPPWHSGSCWRRPARNVVELQRGFGSHPGCVT